MRKRQVKDWFTMDIASLIGFLGAIGMILWRYDFGWWHAIHDVPPILIVLAALVVMYIFFACVLGSFGVMAAFRNSPLKK